MSEVPMHSGSLIDEAGLTLDDLVCVCAVSREWVQHRVEEGLLQAHAAAPDGWRFSTHTVLRVRRMQALERDFDAVPELAALMADLSEELDLLRRRLRDAGLD